MQLDIDTITFFSFEIFAYFSLILSLLLYPVIHRYGKKKMVKLPERDQIYS